MRPLYRRVRPAFRLGSVVNLGCRGSRSSFDWLRMSFLALRVDGGLPGYWIPAFAGMTGGAGCPCGAWVSASAGGLKNYFPVISGNGVFLRQAQDDRMDVPPLAGVMAAWAASSSG